MSDLTDLAKSSARGSLFLFLGQIASTIIVAFGSILIARLLGSDGYGLYSIVLVVPTIFIYCSDLGISQALLRFSAHYHAQGKDRQVASLIKVGIFFKLAFTLILSVILLLFAQVIAAKVLVRPEIAPLIQIASLYLIGQAVLNSVSLVFIGLDKAEMNSLLINFQAVIKVVVSVLLVVLGLGVAGATLGAGLGFILACILGITVLLGRTCPTLERNSRQSEDSSFSLGLKTMLSYGRPLYFSSLIGDVLMGQYCVLLLAIFVSNSEVGNYTVVTNFTALMTVLTYPIIYTFFTTFSKLGKEKQRDKLEKMFKLAVKYVSLIIIPSSLALAVLSKNAVYTLFTSQYTTAPGYLTLYALYFLLAGLGLFVIEGLIAGLGYTNISLRISLFELVIFLPFASFATMFYGVLGLIISMLISRLLATSYGLYIVHKNLKVNIEPSYSVKILTASFLSTLLVYIFFKLVPLATPVYNLVLGGVLYIASFLVFAPMVGAVNIEDTEILRSATNEVLIFRIPARVILKIERKILGLKPLLHAQQ